MYSINFGFVRCLDYFFIHRLIHIFYHSSLMQRKAHSNGHMLLRCAYQHRQSISIVAFLLHLQKGIFFYLLCSKWFVISLQFCIICIWHLLQRHDSTWNWWYWFPVVYFCKVFEFVLNQNDKAHKKGEKKRLGRCMPRYLQDPLLSCRSWLKVMN